MKTKRRERLIRYAPLVIWVGMILFLSTSQGSMSQTSRFIRPLLEFLFPAAPEETLLFYHGLIRKSAHFAEYSVLGLLTARALIGSSANLIRNYFVISAVVFSSGIAVLDETNQSFLKERTGSPWDVLLDISGGVFGAIMFWLWAWRAGLRATAARAHTF